MTKRANGFVLQDGQRVFSVDPTDIAWRIRDDWLPLAYDGHNVLEHPFLPYIEREAVSRLGKESEANTKTRPLLKDGYEDWRLWWTRIAHAYVTDSCAGLSPVAAASAKILVAAAELRAALASQKTQVAALLGMQIICEAIAAGYVLKAELEATEASEAPRKAAFKNGAGKDRDDYTELKKAVIEYAAKRFAQVPPPSIGKVTAAIVAQLNKPETKEKLPDLWVLPKERTVRDWIKAADKEGKLQIPASASKAGRPKSN